MRSSPALRPLDRGWSRGSLRARLGRRRTGARGAVLAVAVVAALAGCTSSTTSTPAPSPSGPVDTVKDVVFFEPDGTPLRLDACTPRHPGGPLPALVLVHSGEFSQGSHEDLADLCAEGARHGFAAFTIDYRLLPSAFPTQLEDVAAAVGWITADAQAERFSVDPERVALLGTSAGGTIVSELLTGVPGSPLPPSRFVGGAMLSGGYDSRAIAQQAAAANPDALRVTLDYAGCDDVDCARLDDVSAIRHVDAGDPPMFLANSTQELVPLEQATGMAAALKAAGVRHELQVVDGEDHAEFIVRNHPDVAAAMWAFLQRIAR